MYDKFFDFKTKPFELVPNPDFLFLSKSHKKAISYLDYGIKERIGFILLSGEVGSGKTTIIRNIIKNLNGNIHLSKVFNTKVSSQQLIAMINEDFGLEVAHKDKVTLLRDLNDFLIDKYAHQHHTMLIIDEAQNLSPELLEEVRMLSNLETDKTKLLQIILVGQPELREALSQPELRQLRQRISVWWGLGPLRRPETAEYVLHRLRIASGALDELFDPAHAAKRDECSDDNEQPVIYVSWYDAWAFCLWARWKDRSCRLPEEHEWEYAAKAGTPWDWNYWWGDDFDETKCNAEWKVGHTTPPTEALEAGL